MKPYEAALKGSARDRLHHHLDQHLAGGRVHSAAAAGRHHRPPVPRVRGDDHHVHRRVRVRRADADADDGLALPAQREGDQAQPLLRDHRARLRQAAARLRARPRCRAAPPVRHAVRVPGDAGPHRLPLHDHPQGLLPAAGHRPHHRRLRGGAGRVVCRDDAPAGGAGRDRRQGSGGRHLRHGAGRRRLQPHAQQRPLLHHAEAQERARRLGGPGDRAAAAAAREGRGRAPLHAGGAGRQHRRPHRAHPVPVHAAGRQPRRSSTSGRRRCSRSSSRCRCCATWPATSRPRARP